LTSTLLGSLSGTYSTLLAADAFYKSDFIASNNSGVEGGAFLALDTETNQLTVITGATGVEPGQPHPQHIHGFPSATPANARPATIAQDDDLDGFTELPEGVETTGPALLGLTTPPGSGLPSFPTPSGSSFVFIQTYDLDELTFDANPSDSTPGVPLSQILTADNLDERMVELHGLTLRAGQGEDGGEANGTAGYKALLPIAGGEIQRLTHEDVANSFASGAFPLGSKVAALDIQGNAGQAYRLYDIFNREPDIEGLSGWVEALDKGAGLTDVARSFLLSEEFTFNFGALNTLSNEAYVNVLYENVLERPADTGGLTSWVTELNQGTSRESVFVGFTESPENQAQVAPLLANGILLSESVIT
jgi:hypothetical protein